MSRFPLYLGFLWGYVLAELCMAYRDGYAFGWQVKMLPIVPSKFLTFWGHGGMWGDFLIIAPVVAYLLATHATSWPLWAFAIIFFAAAVSGAVLLVPLLEDSKQVASALARDGLLPLAGAMHYLFYTVALSVVAAYYFLTPRKDVSATEIAIVTVAVMVHWALGVLQPPYAVHGYIHLPAWLMTVGVCIALGVLAWRLLPS